MGNLSVDLSGIKPLLGQLGIGQAPASTAPPVDQLPVPPMPPPPTPAQAGFTAYSADPRNQQTIANSLTMPGTPITPPNVPPASPLSSAPVPPPASPFLPYNPMSQYKPLGPAQPDPIQALPATNPMANIQPLAAQAPPDMSAPAYAKLAIDQAELQRQQTTGSGISQIKNPWLRTLARIGDVAGSIVAPGVAAAIPGTTYHHDLMMAQQGKRVQGDQDTLKNIAQLADIQSQTALRKAQGNKADTQADAFTPQTLTRDQAIAINQPDLAGTQMSSRDYAKLVGSAGNNNTSAGNNAATNATKVTTNAATNTTRTATNAATNTARTAISDAANKTRTLVAQMHDSTSRANNENTVSSKVGGPTAGGGFKVPADVTKRAALGSNVLENADAVEGIINKRPDIVGAAGGRYSNVQQMIGSDDPDIQALGVRMHNIALASNGAHGVRAQQAIQKTEDELFGNFKAGPNAIKGALGATRASMQTFLNDENNFATTGKRTGGGAAATPASSPGTSDAAVKVQIPGQPAGTIHASQLAAFKAKYPNAKVIQ